MNERIKELALKAYNNSGQGTPEALSSFMEVYSEKFAELIVKECCAKCDEVQEMYGQYTFTARKSKEAIKEHFGVE